MDLETILKKDEGYKRFPYHDHLGVLTIGVGHNLEANGLSDEVIELILKEDILIASMTVDNIFGYKVVSLWSNPRVHALESMAFQLGEAKLRKFTNMIKAIQDGDWMEAGGHAADSKWAKVDSPERARRIIRMMTYEEYDPVYSR